MENPGSATAILNQVKCQSTLADLGGRASPPSSLGPNSFNFMQFSVKIWPNNRLAPTPWKLAPPPPPCLGNPGFATDKCKSIKKIIYQTKIMKTKMLILSVISLTLRSKLVRVSSSKVMFDYYCIIREPFFERRFSEKVNNY